MSWNKNVAQQKLNKSPQNSLTPSATPDQIKIHTLVYLDYKFNDNHVGQSNLFNLSTPIAAFYIHKYLFPASKIPCSIVCDLISHF